MLINIVACFTLFSDIFVLFFLFMSLFKQKQNYRNLQNKYQEKQIQGQVICEITF